MFDDRSFGTESFDDRSWFFGIIEASYERARTGFVVAASAVKMVVSELREVWIVIRGH
jgi:hypothetical protein